MIKLVRGAYEGFTGRYPRWARIGRFLVSGGLATLVNLGLLYVLTDWVGVWYLISAIISFAAAFFVSFTLQKFWTFEDRSREGMHFQAGLFFLVATLNLGLNTFFLYLLVEYAALHYLLAQIIVSAFIAVENFFIYRFVIFRAPQGTP